MIFSSYLSGIFIAGPSGFNIGAAGVVVTVSDTVVVVEAGIAVGDIIGDIGLGAIGIGEPPIGDGIPGVGKPPLFAPAIFSCVLP